MNLMRSLVIAGLVAAVVHPATAQPPRRSGLETYARIQYPEQNTAAVDKARTRWELRRAGGPRPEVLSALLMSWAEHSFGGWQLEVLDACHAGLVDCRDFIDAAERATDAAEKAGQPTGWGRDLAAAIRAEGALQALSVAERRELYRGILTGKTGIRKGSHRIVKV